MGERADLHLHSCHSDGRLEPKKIALRAGEVGLRAASLTDHDTLAGWPAFLSAAQRIGLETICGVELSCRMGERDTHILGYHVRPDDAALLEALKRFGQARFKRARKIVERLNGMGVPLSFEDVARVAGEAVFGRPHVADALYQAGLVATYEDAFDRYIGFGGPAYVPKPVFKPAEAIELIHHAGGLAVLAHPGSLFSEQEIRRLSAQGLDGVEIVHPKHTPEITGWLSGVAADAGLFTTGGSDFHGEGRGDAVIGDPAIPYELVEEMRRHL